MDASNKKFEEALNLLNEAAKDKKDEIQNILSDKYNDLKGLVMDHTRKQRENLVKARRFAEDAFEEGQEKFEEVIEDVDKKVRKNPWPYIGGAALGALLLGYILGSSKK